MSHLSGLRLDGVTLESLSPAIAVTDVREEAVWRVETADRAIQHGLWLTQRKRERLNVTVCLRAREMKRLRRAALMRQVMVWAEGRVLTWDERPGQRLCVLCTAWPEMSSLRWNEELRLTFTAFAQPWWEDAEAQSVSINHTGGTGSGSLAVQGQVETEAEVQVTAETAVNTLSLTVGKDTVSFTGLGLAAGEKLSFAADEAGHWAWRITATSGTQRSAFSAVSPNSADGFRLLPGEQTVTVTGDACAVMVSTRGRYW